MTLKNGMLDPDDAIMLLIDHQSGLFNTVRDVPIPDLRNYVIALAKTATLLNIPVLTTASVPDGPNGPLIPEIHEFAPHVPTSPRARFCSMSSSLFLLTSFSPAPLLLNVASASPLTPPCPDLMLMFANILGILGVKLACL